MAKDDWQTPGDWVEWVKEAMGWVYLDPCAGPNTYIGDGLNIRAEDGDDGLSADWGECHTAFVNPPYSNPAPWLEKCWHNPTRDGTIALVNAAPATNYWHEHVWPKAAAIMFPRGRIGFIDPATGKPANGNRYEQAFILYTDSLSMVRRFVRMSEGKGAAFALRGAGA